MRLKNLVLQKIKKALLNSFGDVDMYLFGSRVYDEKKGGDIDLAVDVKLSRLEFRKYKVKFIKNLLSLDFDMKIDIVSYNTKDVLLKQQILTNGIKI